MTTPVLSHEAVRATPGRRPQRGAPDDVRLVGRVAAGDEHAFAQLYDRHAPALLSYCRYQLGNRDDAQDAVQQTFLRAHRAITGGNPPADVRPWLYAIARNRCRTIAAARRPTEVAVEDLDGHPAVDGLAEEVQQREDLRALVHDLDGLPEDQRAALVLFELGDLSQRDIAGVLEVPEAKVKALVHQARAHLLAERAARERSCEDVRAELSVARGAALRRGPLRRHLKGCAACTAWEAELSHQRHAIAAVLPVAAVAGARDSLLGTLGLGGGAAGVAAAGAVGTAGVGTFAAIGTGVGGATVALHSGSDTSHRRAPSSTPAVTRSAPVSAAPAALSSAGTASSGATQRTGAHHRTAKARKHPKHHAAKTVPTTSATHGSTTAAAVSHGKQGATQSAAHRNPTHAAAKGGRSLAHRRVVKPVHKAKPVPKKHAVPKPVTPAATHAPTTPAKPTTTGAGGTHGGRPTTTDDAVTTPVPGG